MDDQCYHRKNSRRSSPADSKSTKDEAFVADSNVTGCDSKFYCKCKREKNPNESNDDLYSPPLGIGFSFAMCHPSFPQKADGLPPLVDSGSSKHLIDPELICGVKLRMLEYTRI